jgi:two-component system chemotaxis response regulator CheY
MKCLIVEDDPATSQVMKHMISRYGTVDVIENGTKALDMFRQTHESNIPYDLILMDIMLPEISGLTAVLAIRELETRMNISPTQRVKIIMTTALDDPRTVMKSLYESDANSYLVKPVRLRKLEDELRSLKLIS